MNRGGLTDRVAAWRDSGGHEDVRGNQIFTRAAAENASDPVLVLLHGFPSSSYDFRALLPLLGDRPSLCFDFLGFGLSDKPRDHTYSLFDQADLAEELICRRFPDRSIFVLAHDMGTSVATELMARDIDGELGFELTGALLFNGSIVLDRASLTPAQKLLRSRVGPLAARLANRPVFAREFAAIFSAAHPLDDAELADQWALVCHNGGRTLGHRLVHYLGERVEHAPRWHGAISDWPRPLHLAWGLRDPVATTFVLDAVCELRPGVEVSRLADLGHYPQLEDPGALLAPIERALQVSTGRT